MSSLIPSHDTEAFDIFVSFSRDMADWAAAIESTVERFQSTRGLKLNVRNWRDIDPVDTTSSQSWQDRVGAPTSLGVAVCIVLIGERVGTPLPADFRMRFAIARRLTAAGMDWVLVPGVHEPRVNDERVPLTGLLFELLDALLPPVEGGAGPILHVVFRGPTPDGLTTPNFGSGRYRKALAAIDDYAASKRALEEHLQQLRWLETTYRQLGFGSNRPCDWVVDEESLRRLTRRILEHRFGEPKETSPALPSLRPYDVEHADLFLGRAEEKASLIERALGAMPSQRLIRIEGASGSGKSSLLRAGLLAAARERYRKDEGWRAAFLSLAEIAPKQTPMTALAQELAAAVGFTAGEDLKEGHDVDAITSASRLCRRLAEASGWVATTPAPKLVIIVDQLEVALDRLEADGEEATAYQAFLEFLAALGGLPVQGPIQADAAVAAKHLTISIVVALPSDRVEEADARLPVGMAGRLVLPTHLGEVVVRRIVEGTFEGLGIPVAAAGVDTMVAEAREVARDGMIQPLIAVALRNLQMRWEALRRPATGLSAEDVAEHGRLETAIASLGESAWASLASRARSARDVTRRGDHETDDQKPRVESAEAGEMWVSFRPVLTSLIPPHNAEPMGSNMALPLEVMGQELAQLAGNADPATLLQVLRSLQARGLAFEATRPEDVDTHGPQGMNDGSADARRLDPVTGLDELLRNLVRVDHRGGRFRPTLRSVLVGALGPHAQQVAEELLANRLLWRLPDGGLRLVHERVLLAWGRAANWLEQERQGLTLLTRLEVDAEDWRQHLADEDLRRAEARLELGKDWTLALRQWALRGDHLPEAVSKFIEAAIEARAARSDAPETKQALLWLAAAAGRSETAERLLGAGADCTKLSEAERALMRDIGLSWPFAWGECLTALHVAAARGDATMIRLLAARSTRGTIDERADAGWRALHHAAALGHLEAMRALLEAGATLDAIKDDGLSALHLAAMNGHDQCVAVLVEAGLSPDIAAQEHWRPLHAAAAAGQTGTLRSLLAHGADILNQDRLGWLPVHTAARNGQLESVVLLIEAGSPLEAATHDGHTVLGHAVHSCNLPLIRELIKRGAKLQTRTSDGKTPLHCAARDGDIDVVRLLLEHGGGLEDRDSENRTPLFAACEGGHAEVARYLIEIGADVESMAIGQSRPLHVAAWKGFTDVVDALIAGGAEFEAQSSEGWSALHMAAGSGQVAVVEGLLDAGARIDARASHPSQSQPMHSAAGGGHVAVLDLLLARGAAIDSAALGGITPLLVAAWSGRTEAVAHLIARGAMTDARTEQGETALHDAAQNGRLHLVETLLKGGADTNAPDTRGVRPLQLAAGHGHAELVGLLLNAGAEINVASEEGRTPLYEAAQAGQTSCVSLLLARGADADAVNKDGWSPLHAAARNGHADVVRLLLAHGGSVDATALDGHSVLGHAAHSGNVKLVAELIERGANPTPISTSSKTPLHCAAEEGHLAVVEVLLANGGNVNATMIDGHTVLGKAAHSGNAELVAKLIGWGADLTRVTKSGNTPLHCAAEGGHLAVVEVLLAHGMSVSAKNASDFEPLSDAAANGRDAVVEHLISLGSEIEGRGSGGWRPLHGPARYGHLTTVELLLRHGAKVDAAKDDGWTALHLAIAHGHSAIAARLLEAGALPLTATREGLMPLHLAAREGNEALARRLLGLGAPRDVPDATGKAPLHFGVLGGHINVVQALLEEGVDLEAAAALGNSPFLLAAQCGSIASTTLLAERGARTEHTNQVGANALHVAASAGQVAMLRHLISEGFNIGARSGNGNTALHFAALAGAAEGCRLLIEAGAEVEARNNRSATPLSLAMAANEAAFEAAGELERAGASRELAEPGLHLIEEARQQNLLMLLATKMQPLGLAEAEIATAVQAAMGRAGDDVRVAHLVAELTARGASEDAARTFAASLPQSNALALELSCVWPATVSKRGNAWVLTFIPP